MSVAPAVPASPIAVGDNDPRLPSQPFAEALQDAIAAFFVAGSGISFLYDDVNNRFTVTNSAPLDVEAVQDVVGAMTLAGANVTSTYDDSAGTLTIASTGSSTLSSEDVQDIVAGLLTAGTNVSIAYNDAANTLTVTASGGNNTPATLFVNTEADIPANTPNGTLIVVANSTLPAPSGGSNVGTVTVTGDTALTPAQTQLSALGIEGTPSAAFDLTLANVSFNLKIRNLTTKIMTVKRAGGTVSVAVAAGDSGTFEYFV